MLSGKHYYQFMKNTATQYQIILTQIGGRVCLLAGCLTQAEAVAALDRETRWAQREGMDGVVSIRATEVN